MCRLAAGLILVPAVLAAQASTPDSVAACDGAAVQTVDVAATRPTFRGVLAWWRKVARAVNLHHRTTNEGLVRRFVTLDPGQRCTEFRRSESERILRAQPFIADATVITRRMGDSVHVDVSTVDESSVVGGARLRGASLQALSAGTLNFLGAGMHVEARWENGRSNREGFGGKIAHYQLFGRPYAVQAEGMRRPVGEYYTTSVSHPFYTDLQRIAWHVGYSVNREHTHLRRPDRTELLQPVDRAMWDAGGVLRVGPPRFLGLIGAMALGERVAPRHEFFTIDSAGGRLFPTSDTAGVRRYGTYDALNIAGVLGLRALTFTRMRGLDALDAEQDVGTGTQIGVVLGMHPWSRTPASEAFGSLDAYAGARTRRHFIAARTEIESRLELDKPTWRHLVGSGRAAWYFKPTPRWTSEVSLEGAGAFRTIVPFQLELGDRIGGVRGYPRSLEAGARRLLVRGEQRLDLARFRGDRAAIGAAAFVDAGRIWAGDVPFGVNTPVRASMGAAVLAAVPARSQRTIRAEIAMPFDRSHGARPELRFVVREPARGFWFEPPRIRRARLSAVPEAIFSWP